jgi:hypothetical protein
VRVGELVEITCNSIGVPAGTVALITERELRQDPEWQGYVYTVHLVGKSARHNGKQYRHPRRYLGRDLRVIK